MMPRRSNSSKRQSLRLDLSRQQEKRRSALNSSASQSYITEIEGEIELTKRESYRLERLDRERRALENEASLQAARDRIRGKIGDLNRACDDLPGVKILKLRDRAASLRQEWSLRMRAALRARSAVQTLKLAQEAGLIYRLRRRIVSELAAQFAEHGAPSIKLGRKQKRKLERLEGQLVEIGDRLQERRGARGGDLDPFGLLVARSDYLTIWHYRVGQALLDLLAPPVSSGAPGALSGQAGDGDGGSIQGLAGDLGQGHWGAISVPGVSGRTGSNKNERPTVFKPKSIKAARRYNDGGLAAAADASRRRDRVWSVFCDAAEAAGLDEVGKPGFDAAAAAVLTCQLSKTSAYDKYVGGKRSKKFLRALEIAIASGREAAAPSLRVDVF